jgi:CheY-like chemotaxis protein
MAMVYGFARQSGGFADIATAPGEGTTVSLYLPVAEGAVDDEPTEAPRIAGVGVGQRLLLVDDEPELLQVTALMLEDMGYRVGTAHDADEALALLAEEHQAVDLLITDIVMPGMSGVDLVRRARERLPMLPVLYISGFNRDRLDSVTAARTLFKPFRREELAIAVQRALVERSGEPDSQEQIA